MLGFVIGCIILMLCGILVWELLKFAIERFKLHGIKKQCQKREDKSFERETKQAFRKLGQQFKVQTEEEQQDEEQNDDELTEEFLDDDEFWE